MKKPPLVLQFDFQQAPHGYLNIYGSFENEEPSAKDKFMAYQGRPKQLKIDPTRGQGKTFGSSSYFFLSVEGPEPIRIRAKF